jgi:imidazolonepropionase-like amidohydrolase
MSFSGINDLPRLLRLAPALATALVAACGPQTVSREPAPPESLALTGVHVVDVEEGNLLRDRTLIISGNRIVAIGPTEGAHPPRVEHVVNASGLYVVPGLWDMHGHYLWTNDESERLYFDPLPGSGAFEAWEHFYGWVLDVVVASGVTGFRDPWGSFEVARRVREEAVRGERVAPRFVLAGEMIDGEPAFWPGTAAPAGPAEARATVDSLLREGADFIKVHRRLRPAVFDAVLERAGEVGLPVIGHVPALVSPRLAARTGMRSMEHLTGLDEGCTSRPDSILALNRAWYEGGARDDEVAAERNEQAYRLLMLQGPDRQRCRDLLQDLAALEVWQTPTLIYYQALASLRTLAAQDDPRLRFLHPALREAWRPENDPRLQEDTEADWEYQRARSDDLLEITGMFPRAGVAVLVGTDYPNPYVFPGSGVHDEMELLVTAGFTPLQALQGATLEPARYLEASDSLGTVETGKIADLVLLSGNPLDDIANVRSIEAVVLDGRYLDRAALDSLLVNAERAAAGRDGSQ